MRRSKPVRTISCLSFLALAASARGDGEWLRHFRIGASIGMNVSADFQTSGQLSVSGSNPGPALPGIDHIYDDGFVRVDQTGNAQPEGFPTGRTTFWGYNEASQHNDAANTLTYHGTRSFTANGSASTDASPMLGFDMAYGGTLAKWDRLAIGAEFGFNFNVFQARDRGTLNGVLVRSVHHYDTGPINVSPPPYAGDSSGVGPSISDVPTDLGDETTTGILGGSGRSLEGILYNFRVGPLLRWEFYPRWTLNASAGGALAVFDAAYRFDETVSFANGASTQNRGSFGATELTYGGYAGAVVMYNTGDYWEAYLGANLMTMQDADIARAGRSARLNLGAAIYFTAGINWSF